MHSFALYRSISDILLMAILKGMTVCSHDDVTARLECDTPVHCEQKTVSHVSQNNSSCRTKNMCMICRTVVTFAYNKSYYVTLV